MNLQRITLQLEGAQQSMAYPGEERPPETLFSKIPFICLVNTFMVIIRDELSQTMDKNLSSCLAIFHMRKETKLREREFS